MALTLNGSTAYLAYVAAAAGRSLYSGQLLPKFEELGAHMKAAWAEVEAAVIDAHVDATKADFRAALGEPEPLIEVGRKVQLKSGGPSMIVISIGDGFASCEWFDDEGAAETADFSIDLLMTEPLPSI